MGQLRDLGAAWAPETELGAGERTAWDQQEKSAMERLGNAGWS